MDAFTQIARQSSSPLSFDSGFNLGERSPLVHQDSKFILSIDLEKPLGSGSFGEIYPASFSSKFESKTIVVKLIQKTPGDFFFYSNNISDLNAENQILEILQESPNVVRSFPDLCYIGENYSFLALEKYESSLEEALPKLNVYQIMHCFHQIVQGLTDCHRHDIAHCDIQLSNCLIRENECVLADFGNASHLKGHLSSGLPRNEYYPEDLCVSLSLYAEYNNAKELNSDQAPALLQNLHNQRCIEDIYALSILAKKMLPNPIDPVLQTLLEEMQSANRFSMKMSDILIEVTRVLSKLNFL